MKVYLASPFSFGLATTAERLSGGLAVMMEQPPPLVIIAPSTFFLL